MPSPLLDSSGDLGNRGIEYLNWDGGSVNDCGEVKEHQQNLPGVYAYHHIGACKGWL